MRLLLAVFLLSSISWALEPQLKIEKVIGAKREPWSVAQRVKWAWSTNEEKVVVLSLETLLSSPDFSEYSEIASQSGVKTVLKGSKIAFRLNGVSDQFTLKGKNKTLEFTVSLPNSFVGGAFERNCQKSKMALRSKNREIPFFVGVNCSIVDDKSGVALSVPREVDIASSTLFEVRGKGEAYRYYELESTKSPSGVLGKFTLEYQSKKYDFILESLVKDVQNSVEDSGRLWVLGGAGFAMLKVAEEGALDVADSKPSLMIRVPHFPVWGNLGLGMGLDIALPFTKGENAIAYTQVDSFLNYEWTLGKQLFLRPGLGYVVFSQIQSETGLGLEANELAFGLTAEMGLNARSRLYAGGFMAGLGSKITKSHYELHLSYVNKAQGNLGWGGGLRLQQFSGEQESGAKVAFKQTILYVFAAY